MKRSRFVLAGACIVLMSVALVGASQDPAVPVPQVLPGQPQGGPLLQPGFGNTGGELISAKGVEKLNLTKEQKADYDKLNAAFKAKMKEYDDAGKIVLTETDPAKVKEIFEAHIKRHKEAIEASKKLQPEYLAKVEKLLTEDQKKTFAEVRREIPALLNPSFGPPPFFLGGQRSGQFLPADLQRQLKLTDEQRKKVDDLQKDLETKILSLLTEDQKKQFDDLRKQGGLGIGLVPPNGLGFPVPPPLKVPDLKKVPEPDQKKPLEVPELKKDGK